MRAKGSAARRERASGARAALTLRDALLVDALDDGLDLGLLDLQVRDVEPVDDLLDGRGRRRLAAVDIEAVAVEPDLADRMPVPGELRGVRSALDVEDNRRHGKDPVAQLVERPVEEETPVVDDDHAPAERLDVGEVVGREQHGRAVAAVDVLEELPHVGLRDDVQSDRRLVEEEQGRPVQERGREVAAHALSERQLAHGLVEVRVQAEDAVEESHALAILGLAEAVDLLEKAERLDDGDVPPELGALPEHDPDRGDVARPVAVRDESVADDLARGRRQDPGQHLDRRRFPRAVGADVADHLPRGDRERHVGDRGHLGRFPAHEGLQRGRESLLAAIRAEDLGQAVDANDGLGHRRASSSARA